MNDTERGEKIGTWLQILATDDHEKWALLVPELCEELRSGNWMSKLMAIDIIEKIGKEIPVPEAVKVLTIQIPSRDFEMETKPLILIKVIGNIAATTDVKAAIPALMRGLLGDADPIVREASLALAKIGEPAVDTLFSALCKCTLNLNIIDWEEKTQRITVALMKIGKPAMPEAIVLLGHENERIREMCARILLRTGDERAERFGRIIYGCRKTMGLRWSDHKDIEYAAGLGLEITAETQREFFALIRGRYPEERILEMKRQFAEYYAKVAEELCNRKQDVPMEDTELARLARQRMKQLAAEREKGKQRFSQRLQRAVA